MFSTLGLIIGLVIYTVLIGLVLVIKYIQESNTSLMVFLRKTSIMSKLVIVIILTYMLSFPFQYYYLSKQEPIILNFNGSSYNDILKVDDGVIVVGKQDIGESHISVGTIRKYSFDGELVWEKLYKGKHNKTRFDQIVMTRDENYLVLANEGYYIYDKRFTHFITYNKNGEIINRDMIQKPQPIKNSSDTVVTLNESLTNQSIYRLEFMRYSDDENDGDDETSYITIKQSNHHNELSNQYEYTFKHDFDSAYIQMMDAWLISETNDRIFIGVLNTAARKNFLQFRLLEFDHNLTLINEYKYNDKKIITDVKTIDFNYLITWKPYKEKKAYFGLYDNDMNKLWEEQIKGKTPHITVNQLLIEDDTLYVLGHEYVNATEVGFTNDFSGYVMDYDLKRRKSSYHNIGDGIGLENGVIEDNKLYSVGLFNNNAFFLSNCKYKDDPYKGVLSLIDLLNYKKEINVLNVEKEESSIEDAERYSPVIEYDFKK
ncbi:hypothetical protein [Haloplasma contractile]|uniref:Uncharacterized protein n=1 Tax=Haloplasma contractile SSD-17B TaxID=1033810 RepID=F7Q105_9MOLU|nr:hypothetical protein [Haloplasma contractile]ERJ11352.1 hypothetical protein HLPCO_002654 [Haloplasma contractile SSD-17B]